MGKSCPICPQRVRGADVVIGVLELIDDLDASGVQLDLRAGNGPGPELVTRAPVGAITDDLAAGIRTHRDLVVAIILGRRTGHSPAPCTTCSAISMVAVRTPKNEPRKVWPTCRFDPRCNGRHQPRDVDLDRTAHRPPPTTKAPPATVSRQRLYGKWPSWPKANP